MTDCKLVLRLPVGYCRVQRQWRHSGNSLERGEPPPARGCPHQRPRLITSSPLRRFFVRKPSSTAVIAVVVPGDERSKASVNGSVNTRFTQRIIANSSNALCSLVKKVKVAHTRLPSVGFRSWSRFLAVSRQVVWVINSAVGCHYFSPGLQLPPPQPLRGLVPILLLGERRHDGCKQFA